MVELLPLYQIDLWLYALYREISAIHLLLSESGRVGMPVVLCTIQVLAKSPVTGDCCYCGRFWRVYPDGVMLCLDIAAC